MGGGGEGFRAGLVIKDRRKVPGINVRQESEEAACMCVSCLWDDDWGGSMAACMLRAVCEWEELMHGRNPPMGMGASAFGIPPHENVRKTCKWAQSTRPSGQPHVQCAMSQTVFGVRCQHNCVDQPSPTTLPSARRTIHHVLRTAEGHERDFGGWGGRRGRGRGRCTGDWSRPTHTATGCIPSPSATSI